MTKNPFINAFLASLYIVAVVLTINFGSRFFQGEEETLLIPMAMLSLFVLSASMMGYLFLFQPIQMYLEGEKKEGVTLFLKTVGSFAAITVLFVIAALIVR